MPLNEQQILFLDSVKKDCVHASNILAKQHNEEKDVSLFFDEYKKFHSAPFGDLDKAVEALNEYKDFVFQNNRRPNGKPYYSAQSKFEPTIIEEFIYRILREIFGNGVLLYGSVKAYSSMYFSHTGINSFKTGAKIEFNEKDQDVGIYKQEEVTTKSGQIREISIPIVCIECKTYLDKTMYEGSVATASKIKTGNPHCLFFVVTETYDIASSAVDIEASDIDNIYILRKQRRNATSSNPIFADVFEHMLQHIERNLTDRLSVDEMIEMGYIRQ